MAAIDLGELHDAVRELAPKQLKPDERFVVWFLMTYFGLDAATSEACLLGASKDKGIDALYVDEHERLVHVIQGKYHKRAGNESHEVALALSALGPVLCRRANVRADTLELDAHPALVDKLETIRDRVRKRGYGLRLKLVTTHNVSEATGRDAQSVLRGLEAHFDSYGGRQLLGLWHDYTQGAAPPVPQFRLSVRDKETFTFVDRHIGFESHLASVDAASLAKMYTQFGVRIFARNIRGYLSRSMRGQSKTTQDVNAQIRMTLDREPQYFWYYNNGVTMVADRAEATATYIDVTNAQVINGQQTTRVIAEAAGSKTRAAVLVRVIVIPRVTAKQRRVFSNVINQIVKATNWQNRITLADLQTNDDEQIRLERSLLELDYNYVRRRQSPSETLRLLPKRKRPRVVKEKLAQYVAASVLDHVIAQAKNRLFDVPYYARIFSDRRSAYEYLTFHWLGSAAERVARNERSRRYAKWLVLRRVYDDLDFLRRPHYQQAFVDLVESDRRLRAEAAVVRRLLDLYYRVAEDAYRAARRKEDDLDLATFFKRLSATEDFRRALRRRRSLARAMTSAARRLRSALDAVEAAA